MNEELISPSDALVSAPLPSALAQRYLSARVTVYYHNGVSDTGWILYIETHWIEVVKDNNERLLIPLSAIRLIKLLEAPKQNQDAETLLRASGEIGFGVFGYSGAQVFGAFTENLRNLLQ